ncbi:MAG: tyrosine-type recombinase/integrase [Betaproteobacteria bacterium]|nr:tyrosine-type recombinase/integrase [Betaproteobacteria bacterium]
MADRVNLTKAAIDAFPPAPKGKRAYYYDSKAKGLAVAVTDKGTKSFIVYRWVSGRPERITLGRYAQGQGPGLTIEQARKAASEANLAIAKGENPAEKKRTARGETTLGSLFKEYCSRHAEVHNRRPDKAKSNYRLYLSHWENRKLSNIKRADIQALHAKLGRETGKVTANIAVKLLRAMFNKAMEWEMWDRPNPAKGIQLFPEASRERFLQPDELPRFFKALADEPNETIRDYLLMSLLTGARRSNVLAMRWEEVNLDRAEWRIPTTKSGKPHTVPLLPEALEILKRRQPPADVKDDDPAKHYVFPGSGTDGHLVEPKKGWHRTLQRAELYQLTEWLAAGKGWTPEQLREARSVMNYGKAIKDARAAVKALGKDPGPARISDLRIHDLRRTLGSWQAATGASLPMIGRTLAHKNVSTTAIYARLSLDPVRESMQKAAAAMMAAGGLLPKAKVSPIGRGKRHAKSA